jgi:hypothetical protein
MDLARQFFRLALLGAINHQVTHIVVAGSIFADLRGFCKSCHPRLGQLVNCNLCFGTWVGLLMALLFRPRFVEPNRPGPIRRLAAYLADAFAIALAGRFYTEVLAILAGQAAVKKEEQRLLEEQAVGSSQKNPLATGC